MPKVEQQTVSLKCYRDGNPVYVEFSGIVRNGLLLHKDLEKPTHYTVSHIATGLTVFARFRVNQQRALAFLEELSRLLDWTKEKPSDPAYTRNVSDKVRELAKSIYK